MRWLICYTTNYILKNGNADYIHLCILGWVRCETLYGWFSLWVNNFWFVFGPQQLGWFKWTWADFVCLKSDVKFIRIVSREIGIDIVPYALLERIESIYRLFGQEVVRVNGIHVFFYHPPDWLGEFLNRDTMGVTTPRTC